MNCRTTAARARPARHRPLERVAHQRLVLDLELVVGIDHVEELVLRGVVEAEPKPEPSDSDTFSSTASDGLMAVERSFSIMSRGIRWRRLEVA